jgi:hypothetical protein
MAIDPQGRYLYVSDEALNNITGFTRNTTTGVLTKFSSPPFTVSSNSNPAGMAADPTGNFVYVANSGPSNNISALRIDQSTGALSNVTGSPFVSGQHPLFLAVVTPAQVTALGIRFASPTHGGNAGTVTMQIVGSGFQSGATVKLTGIGSDIIGSNSTVPNASVLSTTFDLTGATPGVRNVVVTNPDNTTTTLTGGFTVEQGGAAQISVDIIGRDKIRIGTPQTYYLAVVNRGNLDAGSVNAFVFVPTGVSWSVPTDVVVTPYQQPDGTVLSFYESVNAAASSFVPISLVSSGSLFTLQAWSQFK